MNQTDHERDMERLAIQLIRANQTETAAQNGSGSDQQRDR